jgi:hypothetical protein
MKLRDLSPAIVTVPLLLLPVFSWQSERDQLAASDSVMGRVIKVSQYKCSSGTGGARSGRTARRCFELTIEYRTSDGRKHRRLDYERSSRPPPVGKEVVILVDSGKVGRGNDKTMHEAYNVTRFVAFFGMAMFALGLYASVLRVRRRRASGG